MAPGVYVILGGILLVCLFGLIVSYRDEHPRPNKNKLKKDEITKVSLREANMHFHKYIKMVRQGQEIVVTERGTPIAVLKPLGRANCS